MNVYSHEAYDLLTTGSIGGDVEWYVDRALDGAGPVLELGVGTGRTAIPVAAAGREVVGLDSDPVMLERCRARIDAESPTTRTHISVLQGDMRDFDLGRTFAQVQIPHRAFLHNLTTDDQLACLRRCAAHLAPEGQLVLNVFHPSLEYMAESAPPTAGVMRISGHVDLRELGFVVLFDTTRYDTASQTLVTLHRHEWYSPAGELERTTAHRLTLAYLYPGDLRYLLAAAGFHQVRIDGGFEGQPFSADGQELVVTARR